VQYGHAIVVDAFHDFEQYIEFGGRGIPEPETATRIAIDKFLRSEKRPHASPRKGVLLIVVYSSPLSVVMRGFAIGNRLLQGDGSGLRQAKLAGCAG